MKRLLLISLLFITCCSSSPIRDFKVQLWMPLESVCLERLNDSGEVIKLCPSDNDYPKDFVNLTVEDYNKERGYQDLLKYRCKVWKD